VKSTAKSDECNQEIGSDFMFGLPTPESASQHNNYNTYKVSPHCTSSRKKTTS